MSATILKTTPISGHYPEIHFGKHFFHSLWVEFEDTNGKKWNGCFAKDPYGGLDCVLTNKENQSALIVAGGQGYLINFLTRELLAEIDYPPLIESAIATKSPDYFIIGTAFNILIFDKDKLVRKIVPNQTVDGIFLKEQRDIKAIGELNLISYDGYNLPFDVNLISFEMEIKEEIVVKKFGPITITKVQPIDQSKKRSLLERLFKRK